jgi:hypothetical protein
MSAKRVFNVCNSSAIISFKSLKNRNAKIAKKADYKRLGSYLLQDLKLAFKLGVSCAFGTIIGNDFQSVFISF